MKAFFTGMNVQTVTVRVTPGAVAQQDFDLVGFRQKPPGGETVKLSEFVVATKRQMDGAAIAINEQRLRPGTKLPSIRKFAQTHKVSHFTAVEAYDRLVALGYLTAVRNAGFYVRSGPDGALYLLTDSDKGQLIKVTP